MNIPEKVLIDCKPIFLVLFSRKNNKIVIKIIGKNKQTKQPLVKNLVSGRNFVPREDMSWHRGRFHVKGRYFLSQQENSYVTGKNLQLQKEVSSHRKKISVTGRNFFPRMKFSLLCHSNEVFMAVLSFLSHRTCFISK